MNLDTQQSFREEILSQFSHVAEVLRPNDQPSVRRWGILHEQLIAALLELDAVDEPTEGMKFRFRELARKIADRS